LILDILLLIIYFSCRESEEYGSTGERSNEKTAQLACNALIQKQFALRKGSPYISAGSQDSDDSRDSRVKSAATTAKKVNGLTVKVHFL
jgi:hypothetical protein